MMSLFILIAVSVTALAIFSYINRNRDDDPPATNGTVSNDPLTMLSF